MKTIKNIKTDEILRIKDALADNKVSTNEYEYCPKSEWKQKVRDAKKEKVQESETDIPKKSKKKKK